MIGLLVTAGYGNGTLAGNIAHVVTRGYDIGAAIAAIAGGVKRKKKVRRMPDNFYPWEVQEQDTAIVADPRPRKKIEVKPDFDSTLTGERLDAAIRQEFVEITRRERKRVQRKRAIEMLLEAI